MDLGCKNNDITLISAAFLLFLLLLAAFEFKLLFFLSNILHCVVTFTFTAHLTELFYTFLSQ